MPGSYTDYRGPRPTLYRTPSPPWDAVEPISPIATDTPTTGAAEDAAIQSPGWTVFQPQVGYEALAQDHGKRSNSSMEIFAEIALSAHPPPLAQTTIQPRKRSLHGVDMAYPPSKRSKSEKLPSPELSRKQITTATRPATSYEQTSQCRMMDAELLLNFSNAARLTCSSLNAPDLEASRQGPPAQQHEAIPEPWDSRQVSSQAEKEKNATSKSSQWKDGAHRLNPYPQHDKHAMIVLKEDHIQEPLPIPTEHGGSRVSIADTKIHHMNTQSGSSIPENLSTEGVGNNESRQLHPASIGGFCGEEEPNLTTADTSVVDSSGLGNMMQQKRKPDPATSKEKPESENSRSAAFCAACKFQRNLSCAEVENNATSWISCDGCKAWFHFACAGFKNEREVRAVDKYRCKKCKPLFGATTYVRKSSRAHSAIDYAGLHQGVIKISDERMEHHYIQPIKDGIITFLPENFARMRPELVTAEFFTKNGGMKEPVVIPAELNPRPKSAQAVDSSMTGNETMPPESSEAEVPLDDDFEQHYVLDEGQDALDMVIPQGLNVRQVAELYGPDEKVEVIDVKSQNGENKKWNMRRWADYYENPNSKVVRNVISLEVSQSKLGRLIRRPKIVRDLDLQDAVWPEDLLAKGEYPRVQFYCLMSVADCFTDFHIDFGGSSVFYHILQGKKTFLFIPPKEKHLKKYEEWCMSPAQNWTFLADQTKECYRVDLSEGDTMLIPSGWIHAVWTPEDSLVIGGNFLTRMNFGMQLRVAQVEKATGVARKFRYPHFQKLHWYTAFHYMDTDPLPDDLREDLYRGEIFPRDQPIYLDFDAWGENSRPGKRNYNARYYSQGEIEGLRDLTSYLLRTVLIDLGLISEGITTETRNAVKKSIPRSYGEPLDVIKNFAAWCTWKRGNEPLHHWAYPDAKLQENLPPEKLSMATLKKLDREAAKKAALQAPRRQSTRRQSLQDSVLPLNVTAPEPFASLDHLGPDDDENSLYINAKESSDETTRRGWTSLVTGSGPNRKTACEACRKRRRACKHKDQVVQSNQTKQDYNVTPQNKTVKAQSTLDSGAEDSSSLSNSCVVVATPQSPHSSHLYGNNSPYQKKQLSQSGGEEALNSTKDESPDDVAVGLSNTALSRPRTKACNDCRKSKVCNCQASCTTSIDCELAAMHT